MVKKAIIGLILLISILVAYQLIKQTFEATRSGERLSKAAEEVYKLEIKNKELKKQLSQIKSLEFLEQEARNKLGLSKKGETIVVIPDDKLKLVLGTSASAQIRLPNWLGWVRLFWK